MGRPVQPQDDEDGPCVPMARKCVPPSPVTLMKMGARGCIESPARSHWDFSPNKAVLFYTP